MSAQDWEQEGWGSFKESWGESQRQLGQEGQFAQGRKPDQDAAWQAFDQVWRGEAELTAPPDSGQVGFGEAFTTTVFGEQKGFWDYIPFVATGREGAGWVDMYQAGEAYNAGKATPDQEQMLEQFLDWHARERGFWGGVGSIAADMPTYAVEFAAGIGIAGIIGKKAMKTAAGKSLEKALTRMAKTRVATAIQSNAVTRTSASLMKAGLEGMAVGVASEVPRAGYGRVMANARRLQFQRRFGLNRDESGELLVEVLADPQGLLDVLPAAATQALIEYGSEMTGKAIPFVSKLDALHDDVFAYFVSKRGMDAGRAMLKRHGIGGIFEEIGEEYLGAATQEAIGRLGGPEEFVGALPETFGQTLEMYVAFGMRGGVGAVLGTYGEGVHRAAENKQRQELMDEAEAAAKEQGVEWNPEEAAKLVEQIIEEQRKERDARTLETGEQPELTEEELVALEEMTPEEAEEFLREKGFEEQERTEIPGFEEGAPEGETEEEQLRRLVKQAFKENPDFEVTARGETRTAREWLEILWVEDEMRVMQEQIDAEARRERPEADEADPEAIDWDDVRRRSNASRKGSDKLGVALNEELDEGRAEWEEQNRARIEAEYREKLSVGPDGQPFDATTGEPRTEEEIRNDVESQITSEWLQERKRRAGAEQPADPYLGLDPQGVEDAAAGRPSQYDSDAADRAQEKQAEQAFLERIADLIESAVQAGYDEYTAMDLVQRYLFDNLHEIPEHIRAQSAIRHALEPDMGALSWSNLGKALWGWSERGAYVEYERQLARAREQRQEREAAEADPEAIDQDELDELSEEDRAIVEQHRADAQVYLEDLADRGLETAEDFQGAMTVAEMREGLDYLGGVVPRNARKGDLAELLERQLRLVRRLGVTPPYGKDEATRAALLEDVRARIGQLVGDETDPKAVRRALGNFTRQQLVLMADDAGLEVTGKGPETRSYEYAEALAAWYVSPEEQAPPTPRQEPPDPLVEAEGEGVPSTDEEETFDTSVLGQNALQAAMDDIVARVVADEEELDATSEFGKVVLESTRRSIERGLNDLGVGPLQREGGVHTFMGQPLTRALLDEEVRRRLPDALAEVLEFQRLRATERSEAVAELERLDGQLRQGLKGADVTPDNIVAAYTMKQLRDLAHGVVRAEQEARGTALEDKQLQRRVEAELAAVASLHPGFTFLASGRSKAPLAKALAQWAWARAKFKKDPKATEAPEGRAAAKAVEDLVRELAPEGFLRNEADLVAAMYFLAERMPVSLSGYEGRPDQWGARVQPGGLYFEFLTLEGQEDASTDELLERVRAEWPDFYESELAEREKAAKEQAEGDQEELRAVEAVARAREAIRAAIGDVAGARTAIGKAFTLKQLKALLEPTGLTPDGKLKRDWVELAVQVLEPDQAEPRQPKKTRRVTEEVRRKTEAALRRWESIAPDEAPHLYQVIQEALGEASESNRPESDTGAPMTDAELERAAWDEAQMLGLPGKSLQEVVDNLVGVGEAGIGVTPLDEIVQGLLPKADARAGALRVVQLDRDKHHKQIKQWHDQHHSGRDKLNAKYQWAVAITQGRRVVAMATGGTPSGRWSQEKAPHVFELQRVISSGEAKNASSLAARAAIDYAKDQGKTLVTYTTTEEQGSTYKALSSVRKDNYHLRPTQVTEPRTSRAGEPEPGKIRWEAGPLSEARVELPSDVEGMSQFALDSRTVFIVGCSKGKCEVESADQKVPAGKLYVGDFFEKRLGHVRARTNREALQVFILSAKHGLLRLSDEIATYDTALKDLTEDQYAKLVAEARAELLESLGVLQSTGPKVRVEIHAGKDYTELVKRALAGTDIIVATPMAGLGIGEQKRYYKEWRPAEEAPAKEEAAPAEAAPAEPDLTDSMLEYEEGSLPGEKTLIDVKTESGTSVYHAEYVLAEANSLTPSHDPTRGFVKKEGGDLNERPYEDPVEGKQYREMVLRVADQMNPRQLLTDDPTPTGGPSIVTVWGVVLGGNARAMGLQLAYSKGQGDAYVKELKRVAARFGFTPKDVDEFENPVLVRQLVAGQEGKPGELSRVLNEPHTAPRTATTDAVARGRVVTWEHAEEIVEIVGDDTLAKALGDTNKANKILGVLVGAKAWTDTDVGKLTDPNTGKLSKSGRESLELTLLGAVMQDVRAMSSLAAGHRAKFLAALTGLLKLKSVWPEFGEHLVETADALAELRTSRKRVSEALGQSTIQEQSWKSNPVAVMLAGALQELGPRQFATLMREAADAAYGTDAEREAAAGQTGMFGVFEGLETKDAWEALRASFGEWETSIGDRPDALGAPAPSAARMRAARAARAPKPKRPTAHASGPVESTDELEIEEEKTPSSLEDILVGKDPALDPGDRRIRRTRAVMRRFGVLGLDDPISIARTMEEARKAAEGVGKVDFQGRDNIYNIIKDLSRRFGMGQPGVGKSKLLRRWAAGFWMPDTEGVRLRKASFIATYFHELGHELHKIMFPRRGRRKDPDTGKMTVPAESWQISASDFPKQWRAPLVQLGRALYGDQKPAAGYTAEGWAEVVRYLLADPEALRAAVPTLYEDVVKTLQTKHPETWLVLQEARQRFRAHLAGAKDNPVAGFIARGSEKLGAVRGERYDRWRMDWTDRHVRVRTALEDLGLMDHLPFHQNPYWMMRRVEGATVGDLQKLLHTGTWDVTDPQKEFLGKGLVEILEPVKDQVELWEEYAIARRVLEKRKQGFDVLPADPRADVTAEQHLQGWIAEQERIHPHFVTVHDEFQEFNRWVISEYMVHMGMLTPEQAERIIEKNQEYITFRYATTHGMLRGAGQRGPGKFVNLGSGVSWFKGSQGEPMLPPIPQYIAALEGMIGRAHHNAAARALLTLADDPELSKRTGRWFQRVERPIEGYTVQGEQLSSTVMKKLGIVKQGNNVLVPADLAGMDAADLATLLDMIENFDEATFWKPGSEVDSARGQVRVMVKGKPQFYEVSGEGGQQLLWQSLEGFYNPTQALAFAGLVTLPRYMEKAGSLLRAGATQYNISFGIMNMMRDVWLALALTTTSLKNPRQIPDRWKGIVQTFLGGNWAERYEASGASMSGIFGEKYWNAETRKLDLSSTFERGDLLTPETKAQAKAAKKALAEGRLTEAARSVLKAAFEGRVAKRVRRGEYLKAGTEATTLPLMGRLNERFERLTRMGEFIVRYKEVQKASPEKSEQELLAIAGHAAANITIDFVKGGRKAKQLNRVIPFFNAAILGADRLAEVFAAAYKKNGPAGLMRAFARISSFMIVPSVLQMLMVWDDEEYWNIDQERRDRYWYFPSGRADSGAKTYLRYPKPYGLAAWTILTERSFASIFGINPQTGEQSGDPEAVDWDIFAALIKELSPTFSVAGLQPIFEVMGKQGYDFYWDQEIVPLRDKDLPVGMQGAERSSRLARMLGHALEYPPAKIDHLIYGFTAGAGRDAVRTVIDPMVGWVAPWTKEMGSPYRAEDLPIIRRMLDQEGRGSNEVVQRFYEDWEDVDSARRGLNRLVEVLDRNHPRVEAYKKRHAYDLSRYRMMSANRRRMSQMWSAMRAAYRDVADSDELERRILKIQRDIVEAAKAPYRG